MAATTGTAFFPSTTSYPNTTQYPGQGTAPIYRARYTTDDISAQTPNWLDATTYLRGGSTSSGRETELSDFEASTAELVLDNRTRVFDPNSNSLIRPMNRWFVYEEFSGDVQPLFYGYAESYKQEWADPSMVDATATVSLVDELKPLGMNALPVTSPPRDSYAEVVLSDDPAFYWKMDDPATGLVESSSVGNADLNVYAGGSFTDTQYGAIVGDPASTYMSLTTGTTMVAAQPVQGDGGDAAGLGDLCAEFWWLGTLANSTMVAGPLPVAGGRQWVFTLTSAGAISFAVHTATSTYTATSAASIVSAGSWYHIVGTMSTNVATLYVNGVNVASVVTAGLIITGYNAAAGSGTAILNSSGSSWGYDEFAFYRHNLSAASVLRHYQAGSTRGFPLQAISPDRIGAVLDSVSSHASRRLLASDRSVLPLYMAGQSPLDMVRASRTAENVDSALFVDRDGTLTFLGGSHRTVSPYNTSQATFGMGGGSELPYLGLEVDYSDSYLFNEWNVTAANSQVTQTATDATSIARYGRRSESVTGIGQVAGTKVIGIPAGSAPNVDDASALTVANAMLAKYKDPLQRVLSINPNMNDAETAFQVFKRELMDQITVKWTPPGGGSTVTQNVWIQKIEHRFSPGVPVDTTLSVSPL